jgi:sugar phosphate isomerase/epimerase
MFFGYNTNGFAHHGLEDTLAILSDLGYEGVALTLDYQVLNPYAPDLEGRVQALQLRLQQLGLGCVIETGARFLLDPWHKHQPTLLSSDPDERLYRLNFLRRAVLIAVILGAECVSFWSGSPTDRTSPEEHFRRLVNACQELSDYGAERGVGLAFEPEPGMFIDTMERFALLHRAVNHPAFGLTLDIGHLHCQGEDIADNLRRWRDQLRNIHIEDMKRGVHEHLMFGEGEIDFAPVLRTLREIDYPHGVYVELSRHSHDSVNTARRALEFLKTKTGG